MPDLQTVRPAASSPRPIAHLLTSWERHSRRLAPLSVPAWLLAAALASPGAIAAPTVKCVDDATIDSTAQDVVECGGPTVGPWKAHLASLGGSVQFPPVLFHDVPGRVPQYVPLFEAQMISHNLCSYTISNISEYPAYWAGVAERVTYLKAPLTSPTADLVKWPDTDPPCAVTQAPGDTLTLQDYRDVECPPGWKVYGDPEDPTNGGCYRPRTVPDQCTRPLQIGGATAMGNRIGNPIDLARAAKVQAETDYQHATRPLLAFQRHYDSSAHYTPRRQAGPWQTISPFWRHNWDRRLDLVPGLAGTKAVVTLEDGSTRYFQKVGSQYVGRAENREHLHEITDAGGTVTGWRLITADGTLHTFDRQGRLVAVADRHGEHVTLHYSGDPGTTADENTAADGSGQPLPAGHLVRITDPFGRQLGLRYQVTAESSVGVRLTRLLDPDGRATNYRYTGPALTEVAYPDGTQRRYGYRVPDATIPHQELLTAITDENGTVFARFAYQLMVDGTGVRVLSSEHGDAGADKYTVTAQSSNGQGSGHLTLQTPLGASLTFTYANVGGVSRLTSASQPGGAGCLAAASALTYDAQGNVASRTDFNGHRTTSTYDLTRNLETQRIEAAGTPEARTISTQWHADWRLPVQVAEPKKLTTWAYHGDGTSCAPASATVPSLQGGTRPIGVLCQRTEQATSDANGSQGFAAPPVGLPRTWAYTYNQYGQVLTADGPRTDVADVTTYTYHDAADPDLGRRGQLASVTNALGQVTQIPAYDAHGRPLTLIDPNGVVTTLAYDARGRLTAQTVGSETTTYAYDGVGQLLQVTLPDGRVTAYTYDSAHRLTRIADALGNTVTYTLDAMGNRVQEDITDPAGALARTRRRVYDTLSRLAQDIGAQGQSTRYEYDPQGNRTKVTDPLGHVTVAAYDALNRLVAVTDPGQGVTRYGYDGQDQLVQVTDPRQLVTTYAIDGLGQATQQSSPDTGITRRTYDAAGNETSRTDAQGQTTTTAYDALNRPVLVTYADGRTVTYTWDTGPNGLGRLAAIDEAQGGTALGRLAWAYDAHGRVLGETRTVGAISHTVGYAYQGGQLAALTLPSGRQVRYTRNAAGQVSQVRLVDGGRTEVLADALAYAPFGGLLRWTDGAGQVHTRSYDRDGRPTAYTLGPDTWLQTHDAAGRLTATFAAADAAHSATYAYDALDRLTAASLPATTHGYEYDAAGNRTRQTIGGAPRAYTLDPASHRLLAVATTPPTAYTHDANGSVTGDGTATYGYDARGRLARATTAAGPTAYQLNALGQRVKKSGPGGDTIYHYDGAGHLVAESDDRGRIRREYVWLGDTPLALLQ